MKNSLVYIWNHKTATILFYLVDWLVHFYCYIFCICIW